MIIRRETAHQSFLLLAVAAFCALLSACTSSTSTTTPPATASGSLNPPATIEFNFVPVGRWHDTTFSVANTFSDSITITGSTFSAASMAGSMFKDTMDFLPQSIAGGQSLVMHAEVFAADSGTVTSIDTIAFTHAGTKMTTTVPAHAHAVYLAPGTGSTFTFDESTVDTNGMAGPHTDSTYTVLANNLSFGGKTNVIENRSPAGDTSYYHVESNGDVSEYFKGTAINISGQFQTPFGVATLTVPAFNISSVWLLVPFGSQTNQSATIYDSTVTGTVTIGTTTLPAQAHLTFTNNSQYSGSEALTVGTSSIGTQKAVSTAVFLVQVTVQGQAPNALSETHTTTVWYAPRLEFFAKQIKAVMPVGSTKTATTTEILTKFDIH